MLGTLGNRAAMVTLSKHCLRGTLNLGRHVISYWKYYRIFRRFQRFTMIPPLTYMRNLAVVDNFGTVPGIVVECGVWKGGMIAGIAELLGPQRQYFLLDSFEGLPEAKVIDGEKALQWQANKQAAGYHDNCNAPVDFAKHAMELAGVRSFHAIKGWFDESLCSFTPAQPIAVLRLDADWYDSTLVCLTRLFPYVADGGLIILDDYHAWDGCARALHDFLSDTDSPYRIRQYDNDVCFIVKRSSARKSKVDAGEGEPISLIGQPVTDEGRSRESTGRSTPTISETV